MASKDAETENSSKAVKGRDLLTGIPRIIELTNQEVKESLSDTCELIIQSTKNALEDTPPELAADIVDRGIVLSGGGSLLRNLDILLRERTKLTMDENIIQYVKKKYNLLIGEKTAEQIKIDIGCAFSDAETENSSKAVKGRDLLTGIPRIIELTNQEVKESLSDTCELIIQSTKNALEDTPPELAADIVDRGIVLSGGGSLLRNLDILLRERTKLPIIYAENPLSCVALGVGSILNNLDQWKKYFK